MSASPQRAKDNLAMFPDGKNGANGMNGNGTNGNGNGSHANGNGNGNGHGSGSRWWSSLWSSRNRAAEVQQDFGPYRRLALQLHYELPRGSSSRSVLLVTPTASELCAHGSALLATCMGEELGKPVLFVDACVRRAEASHLVECSASRGLVDALADPQAPISDFVLPTTKPNVSFLPAGNIEAGRVSTPEAMSAFVKAAEEQYDFVVLSGGSVLGDSAPLALAPYVGCVLLLIVENETKIEDLDAAQGTLSYCKARQMGLVLTTPVNK